MSKSIVRNYRADIQHTAVKNEESNKQNLAKPIPPHLHYYSTLHMPSLLHPVSSNWPWVSEDDDDDANDAQQDDDGSHGNKCCPWVVHPPNVGFGDHPANDDTLTVWQTDVVNCLVEASTNSCCDPILTVHWKDPVNSTTCYQHMP